MPETVAVEAFSSAIQPTLLTGDGLMLRPWESGDAPAVFEAFEDPQIRWWHVQTASSVDQVGAWIRSWADDWNNHVHAHWAVADAQSGIVVGRAALKKIDLIGGQAEVGYWTMPFARGQAVAPRAVQAVTTWAFDQAGLHRLELTHSVKNTPSCRVGIKAGFVLAGTKPSAVLHFDGWHDMHVHARTRSVRSNRTRGGCSHD
jgi:RimJ/RimL family protein N-acetyltransferase